MKRDMNKTAEKANYFPRDCYDIRISEIQELINKARNGSCTEAFDAIVTAFKYGFVLGNRATVAGKIQKRL